MGELVDRLPARVDRRYYEPFLGGGALFFELGIPGSRCVVNDAVPDVAETYQVLRDRTGELITELRSMAGTTDETSYYAVRAENPDDPVRRAARTIYLNRTCFNGLYRTNSSGRFNVPYGKLKHPEVCNEPLLRADATRLRGVRVTCGDFEDAVAGARSGDFVYFDPPYIPASPTAAFSKYAKDDFTEPDQRRLAKVIEELTARGVAVLFSNSDTDLTTEIFGGILRLDPVSVTRSIAANAERRGSIGEVIGTNYHLL